MTVQEHFVGGVHPSAVEVYDFRRPTTLAREHSRVLDLAFETFARQWGTQLTAKVRVICQVTSEQVIMQTYDEYAATLPATTAMVLCAIEDNEAKAVIQFSASAALDLVEHMLGGRSNTVVIDRKFTEIEQALVLRLMDDALEGLQYSLGSIFKSTLSVHSIQYNSQFAQAAATSDLMIVALFEIKIGERMGPATVAIPADVLLSQLGEANPMALTDNARELVEDQLANTPIDVSLQVSPIAVKPGFILKLAVGDVLPLPHAQNRPFDVAVGGQIMAQAAAGANGSRLACVIVSTEENQR
ncbi:flagellar motor switch protein FliM [Arthrobacter roseus]|uniref:flagellar motor switch protein FliM n=1 Tax=Arthrobacter roseus TaxID=136274 RepID=UPI0030842C50|nr:flagellar motor switch protein FliM [Arthrobacter roseus]